MRQLTSAAATGARTNAKTKVGAAATDQADVRDAVKPSDPTALVGAVLGGIADFLSNLFLILISYLLI